MTLPNRREVNLLRTNCDLVLLHFLVSGSVDMFLKIAFFLNMILVDLSKLPVRLCLNKVP